MATYKTPGVYVEEISTLPPSVAEVSTAIPAFIGYTEKIPDGSLNKPVRINTFLDYEQLFGGAFAARIDAIVTNPFTSLQIRSSPENMAWPDFLMHYALKMYFDNGGGSCYIISVGTYVDANTGTINSLEYEAESNDTTRGLKVGLDALSTADEPTLIVFPDAVNLNSEDDLYALYVNALAQCGELGDRFAIMDVLDSDGDGLLNPLAGKFRAGVSSDYLKYGAAYIPFLQSIYPYHYEDRGVSVSLPQAKAVVLSTDLQVSHMLTTAPEPFEISGTTPKILRINLAVIAGDKAINIVSEWKRWKNKLKDPEFDLKIEGDGLGTIDVDSTPVTFSNGQATVASTISGNGILATFTASGGGTPTPQIIVQTGLPTPTVTVAVAASPAFAYANNALTINVPAEDGREVAGIINRWESWKKSNDTGGFELNSQGTGDIADATATPLTFPGSETLSTLKSRHTDLYNKVKLHLKEHRVVMPPSAAMAGIYARIDRARGVWKAPANVSITGTIGPSKVITAGDQENLNVDATSGKSINAIRSFTGKGTLVWGARTLAGNDNEWRYISVRRLFNLIEESIRKSTAFAVFEPNDTSTWLKVKAMIDSYLYGLWQQGALAGSTAEQAFFVAVGLGKTMTTQDILEGRMIVEVGIAAVRPAEFIILRFSHKLQQA